MRHYSARELVVVTTEYGKYAHYCRKIDWPDARRSLCGLTDVYLDFLTDDQKVCVRCRGFLA